MPVLAKTHRAYRPSILFTYNPRLRLLARRVLPVLYSGGAVVCPCCDRSFRKFIPRHGVDSLCPGCLALQRHRLLILYLLRETDLATGNLDILHMAPEDGLQERFLEIAGPGYVTVDASPTTNVSVHADITALPFPDDSFDLVICSHVLEHVQDDTGALRELFRVLRPGGTAVLPHPVHEDIPMTVEDPAIVAPRDRLEMFGATDHVRVYGADFRDRVKEAGFDVSRIDYQDELDSETVRKHGLGSEGRILYVATKPSSVD